MKKADNILTADIHIRETLPKCRLDDFVGITQWKILDFLSDLQMEHDCPILNAGDLFEHWDTSPWLLTETIKHLPEKFYTVLGQHDLPNHNYEARAKSGVTTLGEKGTIEILPGVHWGQDSHYSFQGISNKNILVIHTFVWDGKNLPWKRCNKATAEQILEKYPDYDLIITGDHHRGFVYKKDNRLLVNPGCFTVQEAKYIDYDPRVYLWYADRNEVEPVYIPNDKKVLTREHIDIQQNREKKLEKYVQNVKRDWKKYFGDYTEEPEKLLKQYFMKNNIEKDIQQIICKSIEEVSNENN